MIQSQQPWGEPTLFISCLLRIPRLMLQHGLTSLGQTLKKEMFHIYHQSLHMALILAHMLLTMFIDLLAKHYLTSHSQWRGLMYFYKESVASELLQVGW